MKKVYAILSVFVLLLISTTVNAQSNVTSSGISIQGIARDENNSALANIDQLGLSFTIYYLGSSNNEINILNKTDNVKTDNFGVFSYVMVIDQNQFNMIGAKSAYLKVTSGSVVFSNEKLQAVPYAFHAQNGVPTGSIMPFIGTVAPNGWLLCDGSTFVIDDYTANLKALLGSNTTPNLKGMFLRGTGTAATGKIGPGLKEVQQDDVIAHLHGVNIPTTSNGSHSHNTTFYNDDWNGTGGGDRSLENDASNNSANAHNVPTDTAANHTHNVVGNTANNGIGTETRPINYGVNYIIKI